VRNRRALIIGVRVKETSSETNTATAAVMPNWKREFANGFVRDLSDKALKTLVAQVHTSVGKTVDVHPRKDLLDALKEFR